MLSSDAIGVEEVCAIGGGSGIESQGAAIAAIANSDFSSGVVAPQSKSLPPLLHLLQAVDFLQQGPIFPWHGNWPDLVIGVNAPGEEVDGTLLLCRGASSRGSGGEDGAHCVMATPLCAVVDANISPVTDVQFALLLPADGIQLGHGVKCGEECEVGGDS